MRNDLYFNRNPMLVDPNAVAQEDEQNLLNSGAFEGLPPMAANAPNPTPQLPMFSQPTPELPKTNVSLAPVGDTVQSYQAEQRKASGTPAPTPEEEYAIGYPMKRYREMVARSGDLSQQLAREGGGVTPASIKSLAPSWYKSGKPPAGHSTWATGMEALGGAIGAPIEQRLKDPNRDSFSKQKDAGQLAAVRGLSTLFQHLFNRGGEQYDRNQKAAMNEAKMMHTLPGGKTATAAQLDQVNKYIQQAQHQRMSDSLEGQRQFVQKTEQAKHDPTTQEVQAMQQSLIARGVPREQVEGQSYDALVKMMGLTNTQMQAQFRAEQSDVDQQNREREIILKANVDQDQKLDDELRKEEQRRGQAAIPGIAWDNNTPPGEATVKEARNLYKFRRGMTERLDEMQAIQTRLEEKAQEWAKAHGYGENVGAAMAALGPIQAWQTLDPEVNRLVNKAVIIQRALQNFVRSDQYANLGVMQEWEDKMTKSNLPVAGTISGYLRGHGLWQGLREDVQTMWNSNLAAYGAHEMQPGEEAAPVTTVEQRKAARPARPVPARARYDPKTHQKTEEVTSSETLPTTETRGPMVSSITPSAPGMKRYKITYKGKSQTVERSPDAIAKLQKLHPDLQVEEL